MIQVTFCSKQLFEKKNEVDVSLRLPADAETMKRYLEAAGVKDINKVKNLKGKESWEVVMIAKRRKTMVVCYDCHQKIHHGF